MGESTVPDSWCLESTADPDSNGVEKIVILIFCFHMT